MSRVYALGFVGAGNMAEAIARGAIEKGVLEPGAMIASDPSAPRQQVFEKLGIKVVDTNAEVIALSGQVMLAIKPQVLPELAGDLAANGGGDQVMISIMAGIGTEKLSETITGHTSQSSDFKPRIIRVMPNTPMMVGLGMAGLAVGEHAQAGDEALAMKLFGAAGEVVRVEEKLMDAITAVSGSGPAYVYYLAEAMEKAASELGLGEHGRLLVSQTILGAARMLADSPDTAAELRRKVTSPGGTTAAALGHMDAHKLVDVIADAVTAAEARGRELGA
jgi:pyrroline-5-carboxylate reductase